MYIASCYIIGFRVVLKQYRDLFCLIITLWNFFVLLNDIDRFVFEVDTDYFLWCRNWMFMNCADKAQVCKDGIAFP